MKDTITIHKEYGEIPLVECQPSKINQIFINILTNAIHSIWARDSPSYPEQLIIKIQHIHSYAQLSTKDHGIGMSDNVKNCIFEPFFTTKKAG